MALRLDSQVHAGGGGDPAAQSIHVAYVNEEKQVHGAAAGFSVCLTRPSPYSAFSLWSVPQHIIGVVGSSYLIKTKDVAADSNRAPVFMPIPIAAGAFDEGPAGAFPLFVSGFSVGHV